MTAKQKWLAGNEIPPDEARRKMRIAMRQVRRSDYPAVCFFDTVVGWYEKHLDES